MNNQNSIGTFKKGSNKIYSSTESDWSRVRPNSFVKLGGSSGLFTALSKEKHDFLKSFESIAPAMIEIKGDISDVISEADIVKLSKKEYSISEIFIKQSGEGYKKGDLLEVADELAVTNKEDGNKLTATFVVDEVDSSGGIKKLITKSNGRYFIDQEKKETVLLKGGYGYKAKAEVNFSHNGQIKYFEKTVIAVSSSNSSTTITLDSQFDDHTSKGKISFSKWSITTKHPLVSESLFSVPVSITRDFTPHLKLPIVPGNNDVLESHYNKTISILDQKIEQLEKKINRL